VLRPNRVLDLTLGPEQIRGQAILRWLAGVSPGVPLTPATVDTLILPASASERNAVIQALVCRGLAAWDRTPGLPDPTLRATGAGQRFTVHMNLARPEISLLADPNPSYVPGLDLVALVQN
jgi:hypothetical protein